MKAQAEADGNIYLPNPKPSGPVDYVCVCMEPSLGRWAKSRMVANERIRAGYRNFLYSMEDFILHYCARHHLCRSGEGYFITDISKGAMLVAQAQTDRRKRYDAWHQLLLDELALLLKPGGTVIAVGGAAAKHLESRGYRDFSKIIHYSGQAVPARHAGLVGREREFAAYRSTISHHDLCKDAEEVMVGYGIAEVFRSEALERLSKSQLTESRRELMFIYKSDFERIREARQGARGRASSGSPTSTAANPRLLLSDLIELGGVNLQEFKIHLATGKNPSPLEAFLAGEFQNWQARQRHRNFQCSQILSLIHLGSDRWLFGGVFQVNGVSSKVFEDKEWFWYDTTELPGLDHLTGRAIVTHKRRGRASYLRGGRCRGDIVVSEIKPDRISVGAFPGYSHTLLSNHLLHTVVREAPEAWVTALSHVAGVYLITDRSNGKLYVGSASGEEGIWQRWCQYAQTGHGGNQELRQVLKERGPDHRRHFQYSILEICDRQAPSSDVHARESHWKDVLCSGEHGYNSN